MNMLEFCLSLEHHQRQLGRTHALAKACDEIGGIFVVASAEMKNTTKEKFPNLDVRSMGSASSIIGTTKPVILDHLAWTFVMLEHDKESKLQRAKIQEIRRKILNLKKQIEEINLKFD